MNSLKKRLGMKNESSGKKAGMKNESWEKMNSLG